MSAGCFSYLFNFVCSVNITVQTILMGSNTMYIKTFTGTNVQVDDLNVTLPAVDVVEQVLFCLKVFVA